ncbi:MAG: DUF3800 domain-containing protein [Paracoccaceae bacterium]
MAEYSDYIVYLDESGSPTTTSIEKDFPIFALACVLVNIEKYINKIVPALQKFKFKYFGHDQTILHEREIRRQSGEFSFLQTSKKLREEFLTEMFTIVDCCDFSIAAAVVNKQELVAKYPDPFSPYEISLLMPMEHLARPIGLKILRLTQENRTYSIIEKKVRWWTKTFP